MNKSSHLGSGEEVCLDVRDSFHLSTFIHFTAKGQTQMLAWQISSFVWSVKQPVNCVFKQKHGTVFTRRNTLFLPETRRLLIRMLNLICQWDMHYVLKWHDTVKATAFNRISSHPHCGNRTETAESVLNCLPLNALFRLFVRSPETMCMVKVLSDGKMSHMRKRIWCQWMHP